MGKNKIILLFVTVIVSFYQCTTTQNITLNESILGEYEFKGKDRGHTINLKVFENKHFEFRTRFGMERKYSEGNYLLDSNVIVLTSVYFDTLCNGCLMPVTWYSFEGKRLEVIDNNKVIYEGTVLKRQKKEKGIPPRE